MTLRYLLDTSIVSSPVSREPSIQIVKQIEQHGLESAIGAPVWHELTYGASFYPAASAEPHWKAIWRTSFSHHFLFFRMMKWPRPGTVASEHDWKLSVGLRHLWKVKLPQSPIRMGSSLSRSTRRTLVDSKIYR